MRLSLENFGIGVYSGFIYGDNKTSLLNNPVVFSQDVVSNYNVSVSGDSPVKAQLTNYWPISAFSLSSTAVGNMIFENITTAALSTISHRTFAVGLTNEISNTPYRMTVYDHETSSYIETSAQKDDHYIAIYSPVSSIIDINDFVPYAVLGPIKNNYIVEFPLQDSKFHPCTKMGIIYANIFHTKNMYNQVFDTDTTLQTDYSTGISAGVIDNCRVYKSVNENNNNVFLVYTFGQKYSSDVYVSAATTYNNPYNRHVITEYPVTATTYTPPHAASNYEFVERIKGLGAWEGGLENKHKSNIFSLKIVNSNLNDSITNTTTRAEIQNSINTVLRRLIAEFIPAHTELFNIYWEGR